MKRNFVLTAWLVVEMLRVTNDVELRNGFILMNGWRFRVVSHRANVSRVKGCDFVAWVRYGGVSLVYSQDGTRVPSLDSVANLGRKE